jgi:vacuolar-type H+-ATPase subunit E/Vma4
MGVNTRQTRSAACFPWEEAMEVKLTSEEGSVLIETLEERDRALLDKISRAQKDVPRKVLEKKEELLESIIQKLEVERTEEQSFSDLWW